MGQISVFMCDTRDDPARERRYVETLLARRVDGLIVAGRRIEPRPSIGAALGIPVVYAMTQSLDSDEPGVIPHDYGGGRIAAQHLLAAINGEPSHGVHTVSCRLVVRDSTGGAGPPASDAA